MIIRREYRFEASHVLPRHPGKCSNLHGHSYRFLVSVSGPIDEDQGMVIDFGDLDEIVERHILPKVDHQHLNELLENPTAEWIAVWLWRELVNRVDKLEAIELYEVEGASVTYRGEFEETSS